MLANTIKNSSELIKSQFLECQHLRNELLNRKIRHSNQTQIRHNNQTFYSLNNKTKSIFENTKAKKKFQKNLSQQKQQDLQDQAKIIKYPQTRQSYRVRLTPTKAKSVNKIQINSYFQQKQVNSNQSMSLNLHKNMNTIDNIENKSKVIHSIRNIKCQFPIKYLKHDQMPSHKRIGNNYFQQQQDLFGKTMHIQRERQKNKIKYLIRQLNEKPIIKNTQVKTNKINFSNHKQARKQKYLECRPWSPANINQSNLSQLQNILDRSSNVDEK